MTLIPLIIIGVMSLAAFAAFGLDKDKAKAGKWRIPERTLFLLALLGGGIGALCPPRPALPRDGGFSADL